MSNENPCVQYYVEQRIDGKFVWVLCIYIFTLRMSGQDLHAVHCLQIVMKLNMNKNTRSKGQLPLTQSIMYIT